MRGCAHGFPLFPLLLDQPGYRGGLPSMRHRAWGRRFRRRPRRCPRRCPRRRRLGGVCRGSRIRRPGASDHRGHDRRILLSFIGTLTARLGAAGPAALGGSWGAVGFLFLLQAVIGLAYSSICEGISGATIGKALIGLRVRDVEGGRCSFGQALIRALMLYIDMIPYCIPAAVYLFSILRSPQRQRAGDAVARTVVVNLASLPEEERTSAATGIAIATPVILVFVVVGVLGGAFFAGPGMSPYGVFKR